MTIYIKRHPLPSASSSSPSAIHAHPLLQRIYSARGVTHTREIDYNLANLLPYTSLSDIDAAVACLYQALLTERRIIIVGDFDVDGATSTALAILALRAFGYKNVEYIIPNRFTCGYGLSPQIVANIIATQHTQHIAAPISTSTLAATEQASTSIPTTTQTSTSTIISTTPHSNSSSSSLLPPLIITVDNGISSYAGVCEAKKYDMQVIITDHHLPQTILTTIGNIGNDENINENINENIAINNNENIAINNDVNIPINIIANTIADKITDKNVNINTNTNVDATTPTITSASSLLSLPPADTIINPNKYGDTFPSKNLAGVGVIFYLLLALRAFLRKQNWFTQHNIALPNMAQFLDLVALGTVADLVPLDYNNRILVHHGLTNIRAGRCRLGIKILLRIANRDYTQIKTDDLAYGIAPRLNAAGRLDDMTIGVACLLSDSLPHARALACELDKLNKERRTIEANMQQQALQELNKIKLAAQNLPPALCIFDEQWHQGVVGVLASKIKDRFHRPTIAFAAVNENEIKGSARSISGVHICDILANIASRHPGLITKFGGHAMAAGLTIMRENYAKFTDIFVAAVQEIVNNYLQTLHKEQEEEEKENRAEEIKKEKDATTIPQIIYTDGPLENTHFAVEIAELLQHAGPWGKNFPEPLFDGIFELITQRIVGVKHLKLMLRLPGAENNQEINAIHFNIAEGEWPNHHATKVRAIYRLDVNEYGGRRTLQLIIEKLAAVQ